MKKIISILICFAIFSCAKEKAHVEIEPKMFLSNDTFYIAASGDAIARFDDNVMLCDYVVVFDWFTKTWAQKNY